MIEKSPNQRGNRSRSRSKSKFDDRNLGRDQYAYCKKNG